MHYLKKIAEAIAERLLDPALSWDDYHAQCRVAANKVAGVSPVIIDEAAKAAWARSH